MLFQMWSGSDVFLAKSKVFETIVQLLMVPLKSGDIHIKELEFLNLSSDFDENTLKLKLSVCTLSLY